MSLTNCTFTSEWDSGETIISDAEIDLSTGEIFTKGTQEIPEGSLIVEYVTLPDGSILNVCETCHEFVLHKVIGNRADCSFGEYDACMNPECGDE
jgi:hypothetical protein